MILPFLLALPPRPQHEATPLTPIFRTSCPARSSENFTSRAFVVENDEVDGADAGEMIRQPLHETSNQDELTNWIIRELDFDSGCGSRTMKLVVVVERLRNLKFGNGQKLSELRS